MRESALQKVMGHTTLNMTLEYARILDQTVEQAFASAVEQMQTGPISWVPSFFATDDYAVFAQEDALNWIRLPHGYCRRNLQLHCESDIKCLLCERFVTTAQDVPRLREMQERFHALGLHAKAEVLAAHLHQLEAPTHRDVVPLEAIFAAASHRQLTVLETDPVPIPPATTRSRQRTASPRMCSDNLSS